MFICVPTPLNLSTHQLAVFTRTIALKDHSFIVLCSILVTDPYKYMVLCIYSINQSVCFPSLQAPRRILEEDVTVRLSSCSDTIILQTPPVPPRSGPAPGTIYT